jgi:hypothetical protein
MRPVRLPTTHSHYDEAGFKAKPVAIDISPTMSDNPTTSDICTGLKTLIDTWSSRRFAVNGKNPDLDGDAIKNAELVKKYSTYKKRVDDNKNYREARRDLIESIGAYCSYCELPTSANLAVEHRLPKHYFPTSFLDWSNFLVACPICNAIKSDNPYQLIADNYYTTDQATNRINGTDGTFGFPPLYAWPQSYWTAFTGDLLPFQYKLHLISPTRGGWVDEGEVNKFTHDTLVAWYKEGLGTIQDNAFCFATDKPARQPSDQKFVYFAVYVHPRENLPGPGITAAVTNIIALTKLNEVNRLSRQEATDFRVALRTLAYFRAHAMRDYVDTRIKLQVTANSRLLPNAMSATGFWGVWMTTFKDVQAQLQPLFNNAFPGTANKPWTV